MQVRRTGVMALLVLAAVALSTVVLPATPGLQAAPAQRLRLATVLPGVVTDADYNALGFVALRSVQTELGVETAYSESVPVPDVERVMREYIDLRYNIIWTHGGQFISQTEKLAGEFRHVVFIGEADAPLQTRPTNLWVIDRNFHVGFYPIGALAAMLTQSGKIAYVGGLTLPFSYSEVHAIRQALAAQQRRVELKMVWVGDFNDPARARQVTDALIAEGHDVIMGSLNLGMLGVFEAVKATPRRVWVTAKYTDKLSFAPQHYVTSVLYDFAGPMRTIVRRIGRGETAGYYPLGFDTGVALQFPLRNVPEPVSASMRRIVGDLVAGRIKVTKDVTPIR
ncbi:MAG: BMP family protein [Armatimonadota bacterium]|nr:BMP family protein [Armatimonadota bacterium]MDR7455376.1 BMP family protein [Armatimonadota bacterium]MDR7456011.1 BMP family protein [Armatimonadota bacterium]MDR7495952.1 BMP family protein [Armatimonadota bacterium]MDR7511286.1 BMP family protein [Armatimonadota bacterium]